MTYRPIATVYQRTFDKPTTSVKAVSVYATESLSMLSKDGIRNKTHGWFHRLVAACCGKDRYIDYDDEPSKSIEIGYPTNFRREDITFPNLPEEQQSFLRDKARTDAHTMYATLHPLRSSPSGHSVTRPTTATTTTTTMTPAPSPQKMRLPVGMPATPACIDERPNSIQKTPSPMHRLGSRTFLPEINHGGVEGEEKDEKRDVLGDVLPYEIQALMFDDHSRSSTPRVEEGRKL